MTITSRKDGKHLEVNDSFCRAIGYPREEIIGRTAMELNFWRNAEDRDRLFTIINKQGTVNNYEFQFRDRSGQVRTGLLSLEIINLRGEECLLSIANDITERMIAFQLPVTSYQLPVTSYQFFTCRSQNVISETCKIFCKKNITIIKIIIIDC